MVDSNRTVTNLSPAEVSNSFSDLKSSVIFSPTVQKQNKYGGLLICFLVSEILALAANIFAWVGTGKDC